MTKEEMAANKIQVEEIGADGMPILEEQGNTTQYRGDGQGRKRIGFLDNLEVLPELSESRGIAVQDVGQASFYRPANSPVRLSRGPS